MSAAHLDFSAVEDLPQGEGITLKREGDVATITFDDPDGAIKNPYHLEVSGKRNRFFIDGYIEDRETGKRTWVLAQGGDADDTKAAQRHLNNLLSDLDDLWGEADEASIALEDGRAKEPRHREELDSW